MVSNSWEVMPTTEERPACRVASVLRALGERAFPDIPPERPQELRDTELAIHDRAIRKIRTELGENFTAKLAVFTGFGSGQLMANHVKDSIEAILPGTKGEAMPFSSSHQKEYEEAARKLVRESDIIVSHSAGALTVAKMLRELTEEERAEKTWIIIAPPVRQKHWELMYGKYAIKAGSMIVHALLSGNPDEAKRLVMYYDDTVDDNLRKHPRENFGSIPDIADFDIREQLGKQGDCYGVNALVVAEINDRYFSNTLPDSHDAAIEHGRDDLPPRVDLYGGHDRILTHPVGVTVLTLMNMINLKNSDRTKGTFLDAMKKHLRPGTRPDQPSLVA